MKKTAGIILIALAILLGYFGKLFNGAFQSLVAGIHGHGGGTFLVFTCKIPVVQKIRMLHELV